MSGKEQGRVCVCVCVYTRTKPGRSGVATPPSGPGEASANLNTLAVLQIVLLLLVNFKAPSVVFFLLACTNLAVKSKNDTQALP